MTGRYQIVSWSSAPVDRTALFRSVGPSRESIIVRVTGSRMSFDPTFDYEITIKRYEEKPHENMREG